MKMGELFQVDPMLETALADFSKLGDYLRYHDSAGTLDIDRLRRVWKYAALGLLHPLTSPASLSASSALSNVQLKLFDHLEDYLFDGKTYCSVADELKAYDGPAIVCGRVFGCGEPVYSCKRCRMARTSVLCMQCFELSEHRNHPYQMISSHGGFESGGFCDCGDPKAWSLHPSCSIHSVTDVTQHDGSDITAKLPSDLVKRVTFMIESCLDYCTEILCKENSKPSYLEISEAEQSLEEPVNLAALADRFVTLLHNDETHSCDEVMSSLTKAVHVSSKVAIGYATMVDQEGRCVISVGTFQECSFVKSQVEQLPPRDRLKTTVCHAFQLAHELLCRNMLQWLQGIVGLSSGFKKIFADAIMNHSMEDDAEKMVVRVMKHETKLWKAARAAWHNLFISTVLMNFERKREFAVVFAENYTNILDHYVDDDQVCQASIIVFSVKLFAIPSIAQHLIGDYGILSKLLSIVITGCDQSQNNSDVPAAVQHAKNKRFDAVFLDLGYLLPVPPASWDQKLRWAFLYGFTRLVAVLNQITVEAHVVPENEWESAIQMQIDLGPVVRSMIQWCGTDQVVLVKAFRMVADKRVMTHLNERREERSVLGHTVEVHPCDISTRSASVHYPLSRLLAGLIQHLPKFGLTWDSPAVGGDRLPFAEYVEHPMRFKALQAQVRAGLWGRNGLSLMQRLMDYSDVRFREEMHDRDLYIIQFAGTQMDPNEYLATLLANYNLHSWANSPKDNLVPTADDIHVHQINAIVEEFLGFLINIVAERCTLTVGQVSERDCARKEILQVLCTENLPHSALFCLLPEEVTDLPDIEDIIKEVADFKRAPTVTKTGVYVLKPGCWEEFNVFYYHYSREDQLKAENNFIKWAKSRGLGENCYPPRLVPFSPMFKNLANVMQCDVMLAILSGLFERTQDSKCYIFTEAQLQKGLFLMGLALRQEEISVKPCNGQAEFQFCSRARESGLYDAFEKLSKNCERVGSQRDLHNWVLTRFKQVEQMRTKNGGGGDAASNVDAEREAAKMRNRLRKEKADSVKNKIMAQMMAEQKRFIVQNQTLYESCGPAHSGEAKDESMEEVYPANSQLVAFGPNQSSSTIHVKSFKCILCQETEPLVPTGKAMVLCAFVQQSTVLSTVDRASRGTYVDADYAAPGYEPAVLSSRLEVGPHVSSCCHVLHADCWRERADKDMREFPCPLCGRPSNTVLPLVAPLASYAALLQQVDPTSPELPPVSMETWDAAVSVVSRLARAKMNARGLNPEAIRREELAHRESEGTGRGRGPIRNALDGGYTASVHDSNGLDDYVGDRDDNVDVEPVMPEVEEVDGNDEEAVFDGSVFAPLPQSQISVGSPEGDELTDPDCAQSPPALRSASDVSNVPRNEKDGEPELTQEEMEVLLQLRPYFQPTRPAGAVLTPLAKENDGTFNTMMRLFTISNYCTAFRKDIADVYRGIPHAAWLSTAFTIRGVECELRDEHKPILGNFTVRQLDTLSPLVKLGGLVPAGKGNLQKIAEMSRCLVDPLFLPYEKTQIRRTSFLHMDAFSVLVSLVYGQKFFLDFPRVLELSRSPIAKEIWPAVFPGDGIPVNVPRGDHLDLCAVRFSLVLHLAQLVVLHGGRAPPDPFDDADDWYVSSRAASRKASASFARQVKGTKVENFSEKQEGLARFVEVLGLACKARGIRFEDVVVDGRYAAAAENACRPFLRCCAMFAHFLSDIPPSAELSEVDGDTFKELSSYVGLPWTLNELVTSVVKEELYSAWLNRWMDYPGVKELLDAMGQKSEKPFAPLTLNRFIKLPTEFTELINETFTFKCPRGVAETRRCHAICLVCGAILCSPGCCCRVELDGGRLIGAATHHTRSCGAGAGVFLLVQDVQILLLHGWNKGCYLTAPYLDEYGEADPGLQRGNPLTLQKEQYLELQRKWLSHGIPETISAATDDDDSNHLGTDWSHL